MKIVISKYGYTNLRPIYRGPTVYISDKMAEEVPYSLYSSWVEMGGKREWSLSDGDMILEDSLSG